MNEKIGKIKLELLKEEFIKQIKDSYTLNLSMVLLEEFENLQQENEKLKDNWNKLKEYISADWYCFDNESVEFEVAKSILDKMQELEQGEY